ncbi:MAG TPA: Gfo/Idh/MocA family oxidoreductase [Micromonosporaceae bacterium]
MRGAIIGFGAIAMGHMAGYRRLDELSVVAVVDPSPARRELARTSFGLATYADFSELITHEQLDFIDVCTPPSTHGQYSALGLAHGMHVLCEKPVFMPAEDGFEDLMRAVWSSDRVFYPCHVYKFAPILHVMREIIATEEFGPVLGANFRTLRRGHAVGVPEWRPDWRREPEISAGGILRDHGPHSIYLAMNLTGRTPMAVSCLLGNMRQDTYRDTEDTALIRMRCEDDTEVSFTLTWASGYRSTGYAIMGTSGSVIVDGDELTYTRNGKTVRQFIESGFDDPSHQEWFVHMLRDFVETVAEPQRRTELIREALVTAFVIEGAYRSAAEGGRWIEVDVPADLLPGSRD